MHEIKYPPRNGGKLLKSAISARGRYPGYKNSDKTSHDWPCLSCVWLEHELPKIKDGTSHLPMKHHFIMLDWGNVIQVNRS